MAKVAIVIISHNNEKTIKRALMSVQSQTLKDIEVAVVDDCSTDSTRNIIEDTICGDVRFSLFSRKENGGAHLARRTGVLQTSADYVLFLDGDDEISTSASEILLNYASERQFDILRFGRSVVGSSSIDSQTRMLNEKMLNSMQGNLQNEDILRSAFSDNFKPKNTWSIIDCFFNGNFIRSSFNVMTDEHLGRLQDIYQMFVVFDRAQKLITLPELKGLIYHLGDGISGTSQVASQGFQSQQDGIYKVDQAVLQYANENGKPSTIKCAEWSHHTIRDIVGNDWAVRLSKDDQIAAISSLRQVWGDENALSIVMAPAIIRAKWIWEEQIYPDDNDIYFVWKKLIENMRLERYRDDSVAEQFCHFEAIAQKIEVREHERKENNQREIDFQSHEICQKVSGPTSTHLGHQILDALLPQESRRRAVIRKVLHSISSKR